MELTGDSDSRGDVAVLISPTQKLEKNSLVTFRLKNKLRPDDPLMSLVVYVQNETTIERIAYTQSTTGFQSQTICLEAGERRLIFMVTWGMYSNPFVAIDNVLVTNLSCQGRSRLMQNYLQHKLKKMA